MYALTLECHIQILRKSDNPVQLHHLSMKGEKLHLKVIGCLHYQGETIRVGIHRKNTKVLSWIQILIGRIHAKVKTIVAKDHLDHSHSSREPYDSINK